uniref:BZIP domain-containing protein n=1 Tax=Auxenochlorella protothecoides TaxID=3075 RepID=A0A1D2A7Y5_AUXPR
MAPGGAFPAPPWPPPLPPTQPVPSPVPPALPAAHNLLQQTLRMQADSGAMAWDPSVAPAATAPRGPGSTSLNPQQLEFAALLRQAGMTGLTEDDIRHLYTVSEGYALQAASTGQPLPLVGAPPPMVPVHAPGAPGAGTTSASTSASLASGSGGRTPPDAGAPEGGAKRRGRRPADTAQLTTKQLRAREAQKRFRDKQKSRMAETEGTVAELAAELRATQLSTEAAGRKQALLERLLEYKDEQVEALELHKRLDPPPGIIIPADIMDILRSRTVPGIYTPEMLLRYAPVGYREHLDERGYVKEAPPFDKVCEDWQQVVAALRRLLDGANLARRMPGAEGSGRGGGPGAAPGGGSHSGAPLGAQPAGPARDPPHISELQSDSGAASRASATSSATSGDTAASATGEAAPLGGTPAASTGDARPHLDSTDPRAALLWDTVAETLVQAAGQAPGAADADSRLAVREGVVIQHGADAYHFSREAYRGAGVLLRRLGLLVWQQAVLFPDNAMRMQAVRGDLGVPDAQENQDVGTWRAILQRLCLRPEQLRGIVAAHREFLVQEQEILRQRAEFMAVLREVGPNSERARGKSQTSYVPTMTAALEATQGLMRGIQAEHAASTALLGAILRWLDFPVQKGLLFTLSWPYMPQGNIIGTCAALEIGLSLEEYVSMPLPPLTEDCYAMRAMTGRAELATQGPGSLEELEGGPD